MGLTEMADMGKIDLPYVSAFKDRHGTLRYRFRHGGVSAYLHGQPGSRTFVDAYNALLTGGQSPKRDAPQDGTIKALAVEYMASPEYRDLAESSRKAYKYHLDWWVLNHGEKTVRNIQRKHIERIRDELADTPCRANSVVTVLRILLKFSIGRDYRKDNPANGVTPLKGRKYGPNGYRPWTPEEVAAFERVATAQQRLALHLLLYTGQRRGDVAKMRWSDFDGTGIKVVQGKTNAVLTIPCHPTLRATLAGTPRIGEFIMSTHTGTAYHVVSFGKLIEQGVKKAGLSGTVVHGLRKTAATRLAEAGCSASEIQSITGHATLAQVSHYTKGADQKRLAQAATLKLVRSEEGP